LIEITAEKNTFHYNDDGNSVYRNIYKCPLPSSALAVIFSSSLLINTYFFRAITAHPSIYPVTWHALTISTAAKLTLRLTFWKSTIFVTCVIIPAVHEPIANLRKKCKLWKIVQVFGSLFLYDFLAAKILGVGFQTKIKLE